MARPDRALAVDAGLTGVLGVVFLAATAGATTARPLDGLGWALLAPTSCPCAVQVALVAATAVALWRLRDT
ncbi:MAG TPA: hypothetical protein VHW42_04205 [Actinomycetes bacterium]|jgi:hypothetical protein|nr:hypothetical protein [Actinomycetes bacterium]